MQQNFVKVSRAANQLTMVFEQNTYRRLVRFDHTAENFEMYFLMPVQMSSKIN